VFRKHPVVGFRSHTNAGPSRNPGQGKIPLFVTHASAPGLLLRTVLLHPDHLDLLSPAFLPDLPPRLLKSLAHCVSFYRCKRLHFVAKLVPRTNPVLELRPLLLAPDLNAGRNVPQPDRGRSLVDLLPTGPASTNETLLDIGSLDAERSDPDLDVFKGSHLLFLGRLIP